MFRMFGLTELIEKSQEKLKSTLKKYTQALQSISMDDQSNSNYKGLFFMPNGDPILILNEDLIKNIKENSILLKNDSIIEILPRESNKSLSQKNLQDNKNKKLKTKSNTLNSITSKAIANEIFNDKQLSTVTECLKELDENFILSKKFDLEDFNKKSLEYFKQGINFEDIISMFTFSGNFNSNSYLKRSKFDILKFINDQSTSDITVLVEDIPFYLHKVIIDKINLRLS